MKKILFLASVSSMIDLFNKENISLLKSKGFKVYVATNFEKGSITSVEKNKSFKLYLDSIEVPYFQIDFYRGNNPLKYIYFFLLSFFSLSKLVKNTNFDIIHTHSFIASFVIRIVKSFNINYKFKVLYTVHGFHFYKGSSLFTKIIYFLEFLLKKYTHTVITMNKEDFEVAKKIGFNNVFCINGIGINLEIENKVNSPILNTPEFTNSKNFKAITIGELTNRKNHHTIIKAIKELINKGFLIDLFIIGRGKNEKKLLGLIDKLHLKNNVFLIGYKENVFNFLKSSDVFLFPSISEGLPVSLMEAMLVGIPIICSDIRGNRDLISNYVNGILVKKNNCYNYSSAIVDILNNKRLISIFNTYNLRVIKQYSKEVINNHMNTIYSKII